MLASKGKWILGRAATYTMFAGFVGFALFPIYWALLTSFTPDAQIYSPAKVIRFFPKVASLEQYRYLFKETIFLTWFANSFIVSTVVTALSSVFSILAAYSIARLRFRGSQLTMAGIFVCYLVPPSLLFIPLAMVLYNVGIVNSIWALIVTYPTFVIPFCTWLLIGYFRTIPPSLEECAMIDGASRVQALIRIVLPLTAPALATVFLFAFSLSWSQFIYPLAFISTSSEKVVSTGVADELIRGDVYYWGPLMCAALASSIPIVLSYVFLTRHFIAGLTAGAMKY
jgi:multiple sugar transport system permease protein